MTPEEKLLANAQLVIEQFSSLSNLQTQFGYNHESLMWVEGFIERQRNEPNFQPENASGLIGMLGSYLGQCIIHSHGGTWRKEEGQWGVFFDDSNAVFPFNKVRKQFLNGVAGGDSIVSCFDQIDPLILKRS